MVDTNLFQRYGASQTQFSRFDEMSIMLYPVDNSLTIGNYEVGWNQKLSDTDKEFIGVCYPFDKPDPAKGEEIAVGGTVSASIGKHGEEDVYRLQIAAAGEYTVETQGQTDVVMALLGPGSLTRLVAEDDDSGAGRNARITASLKKGEYWVRIRHYKPTGTGKYKLSVQKA